MNPEDVKAIVSESFPECDIRVEGEGCNFSLQLVGSVFEGARSVKRQQMVYAALSDQIASGELHAVHIVALTPEEWQARSEQQ